MDIHLGGDGEGGGRFPDDGGIHLAALEHGCTVHLYAITVRPVLGVRKAPRERVGMQWWEQAGIDTSGAREVAATAVEKYGGEYLWRGNKGGILGRSNHSEYT